MIKRLQANNVMVCSFKTESNVTYLYLCCTTRDSSLILMELKMTNSSCIVADVKYKSERLGNSMYGGVSDGNNKESELELFLQMVLCESDDVVEEEMLCR